MCIFVVFVAHALAILATLYIIKHNALCCQSPSGPILLFLHDNYCTFPPPTYLQETISNPYQPD